MAKAKTQTKKVKKSPTKYSKLLVVAQKELAAKKKALVSAERSLAKAKQKHEELIAEVARLDMVERSLKAMVEGTEPPTNVRYVYNYPQWVWYPTQQPYVTFTVPSWQYTPSTTVPNNGTTYYNAPNIGGSILTSGTVTCNAGGLQTNTVSFQNSCLSGSSDPSGGFSAGLTPTLNNVTLTSSGAPDAILDGLVVDLSTGADQFGGEEPEIASSAATEVPETK